MHPFIYISHGNDDLKSWKQLMLADSIFLILQKGKGGLHVLCDLSEATLLMGIQDRSQPLPTWPSTRSFWYCPPTPPHPRPSCLGFTVVSAGEPTGAGGVSPASPQLGTCSQATAHTSTDDWRHSRPGVWATNPCWKVSESQTQNPRTRKTD